MNKILPIFILFLIPIALATDTATLGSVGTLVIGENVSGSGAYVIALGKNIVAEGNNSVVALLVGENVNIEGNFQDAYAMGKHIVVSGHIRNLYAMGDQIEVKGVVDGNLLFYGRQITVEKGAKVGVLLGTAESKTVEGNVGKDALKIEKREEESTGDKAWGFVAGLIGALVFYALLGVIGLKWDKKQLSNPLVYIYGTILLLLPAILFVLALFSLALLPIMPVFLLMLGIIIAIFGAWLAGIMVAGIPVFHILGKHIVKNDYLAVVLGFTAVYVLGLFIPLIWVIVNLVGLGILFTSSFSL